MCISIVALVEPPQSMANAAVAFIIDVVSGQDMNPGRQWADAQPIAGMEDIGIMAIGANQVAAGVSILAQLARGCVRSVLGRRAGKQITNQKSPTARLSRQSIFCAMLSRS